MIGLSLSGKVAMVTGAAGGLGAAIAEVFAEAGARLALVDLDEERLRRASPARSVAADQPLLLAADVSDPLQVERVVTDAVAALGGVDVLVNNAGVDYTLPLIDLSVEQWQRVLGVNLTGAFLFTRAVFPIMRDRGGGHIVNVASTAARRGWANATAYCASKFGLVGFTQALLVEGRPHNIRATVLVPGGMRTSFFDRLPEPPDPRNLQDPRAVAEVALFVVTRPPGSVVHEVLVCPPTETSWP
ncbi:MAG TPA: SDR family oxidoreductase [Chloroflexota bacterium]